MELLWVSGLRITKTVKPDPINRPQSWFRSYHFLWHVLCWHPNFHGRPSGLRPPPRWQPRRDVPAWNGHYKSV